MYHHPQPLPQLRWPLIFRKDSFVINPSPIRFSSDTDATAAIVLNSCFWNCTCASVLIVLNSEDKESKQTGEEGLFFQTFFYLDVLFTFEFLALKSLYNTGMTILSSSLYTDNKIETWWGCLLSARLEF